MKTQYRAVMLASTIAPCVLLLLLSALTSLAQTLPVSLESGKTLERPIKGGEIHSFQLNVKAGEYARAEVEQKNIDVVVSLFDAKGKLVVEMDGNYGYLWREAVSCIAEMNSVYRVQVKAFGTKDNSGSYTVKISERRESTPLDRKRIEAEQALSKGKKLDEQNTQKEEAIKNFEAALKLWREIGDRYWEGVTLMQMSWTYNDQIEAAKTASEQALGIFVEVKDRAGEAKAINNLGRIYDALKQHEKARVYLEKALAIRRELRDRRGEGNTLFNLLSVYRNLKQPEKTLDGLEKLLAIRREFKNRIEESRTLYLLGVYYLGLNQNEKARDYYEKALPIYRELKDRAGEGDTLDTLVILYLNLNQYEKALDAAQQTLSIRRELKDRAGEGEALINLALIYSSLDQYEKALDFYEQALTIKRELKDRAGEGKTLLFIGGVYRNFSQYEKAGSYFEQGLAIAKEVKDLSYEAFALYNLAVVYSKFNQTEKAVDYCEQALAITRKTKKRNSELNMLLCLAQVYRSSSQYDKAGDYLKQSLAIAKELNSRNDEFNVLSGLGLLGIYQSDLEQARSYFEQALTNARQRKDRRSEKQSLDNLALVYSITSKFEKAKEINEQSLAIARKTKDRYAEGSALSYLGGSYHNLSQYEKARELYEQALVIHREVKNRLGEGSELEKLGTVYLATGQYEKARDYFEQSLAIAREVKARINEYSSLKNLGFVYLNLNQYEKARDYLEQSLAVSKELRTKIIGADSFVGLGSMSADFNQHGKAQDFYLQSLAIVREIKDRSGEGNQLNNLGTVYLNLQKYEKAQHYLEQALAIAKEVKNKNNEALAITNLAETNLKLNRTEKARQLYEQSLALAREVKSRGLESSALNGLGDVYFKLRHNEKARDFYEQALVVAREIKSKKIEGKVLWNLMVVLKRQEKSQSAILYGKQAISAFQETRGGIKTFDKESQQSFLKDKEGAYRKLSEIMIAEGRLLEAQTILDLLKDEEFRDLSNQRSGEIADTVPYSKAEADVIAKIENLVALERERAELQKLLSAKGEISVEQNTQLEKLNLDIAAANKAFDTALDALGKAEASAATRVDEIKGGKALQSALTELGEKTNSGVVALYTVLGTEEEKDAGGNPLKDKLKSKFGWVIMVTENRYTAYPIDVTNLEKTVFEFRTALSSNKYNPQPLAEKIYNAIFRQSSPKLKKTLEADLQDYLKSHKDKTLMWSLDGVLRYIPIAALHDGKQYLVENYRNTVFTKESFVWLMNEPRADWQALGLGVSEKRGNFIALPGVKIELETIIREPNEQTGILSGSIKLNENFKKQAFFNIINGGAFPVIHISSHYKFDTGNPENSFLLAGDGNLTFGEIKAQQNLFKKVDLMTLSACDTGISGNGKEAEGFAYLAQSLGAKSVIASLWKVSDAGTPELMTRFYKLRAEKTNLAKGEAIRQAQLALLHGTSAQTAAPVEAGRGLTLGSERAMTNLLPYTPDPQRPYAHPHYWAPFILIGNWR